MRTQRICAEIITRSATLKVYAADGPPIKEWLRMP